MFEFSATLGGGEEGVVEDDGSDTESESAKGDTVTVVDDSSSVDDNGPSEEDNSSSEEGSSTTIKAIIFSSEWGWKTNDQTKTSRWLKKIDLLSLGVPLRQSLVGSPARVEQNFHKGEVFESLPPRVPLTADETLLVLW